MSKAKAAPPPKKVAPKVEAKIAPPEQEARPEYPIPKESERTYPRWYFNDKGHGVLVQSAAHHLDYPGHDAYTPLSYGHESAPAAPEFTPL